MLGTKISELRNEHSITQQELADKLGVLQKTVSKWENNKTSPTVDMLLRIADIFRVSTDSLLELDNVPYISIADLSPKHQNIVRVLVACLKETNKKSGTSVPLLCDQQGTVIV